MEWYYLDPDNRKKKPNGLYCACCMRPLKETQSTESFRPIVIDNSYPPLFRLASPTEKNNGLIGSYCLARVTKEFGIIEND